MRKLSFIIRKVKIGGKKFYQVNVPNPTGKRPKRKTFASESDAETYLESAITQKENFGAAAFSMSDTLRTDATKAAEILAGTGKSLVDAARHYREFLDRAKSGKPIREAVDAFIESRKKMSDEYVNTIRPRLIHFATIAGGKTTSEIGTDDISKFLSSLEAAPRTVAHYWTQLSTLFNFCLARKWCMENPVKGVPMPKFSTPEPEILTPAEAATLLDACDTDILPGLVLAMFCGLRQSEIERLDWAAVDLKEGIVTIGAGIAKTNSRRIVAIPKNAKSWLAPYASRKGKIWPEDDYARNLWNLTRIRAGYGPFFSTRAAVNKAQNDPKTNQPRKDLKQWPANALRHSAISYRVAKERDLAKIAYESGNSPKVIQQHYNGLAKPAAAQKFFSIAPETPGNVRTFHSKAA